MVTITADNIQTFSLNPKRAGIFGQSKSRGGAESARGGFRAPVWSISMQIIHKRVSNES